MPGLRTEFSQLLIYDPDKSRSTVHAYSARPTPLEERAMGRLFLLIEIDSDDPANHQLIEEIQHVVTAEYYGSETFQIETAFERALQKTNERLRDTVGDQLDELLQRLNIIIAVVKDSALHFTVIGRMHAFLVHGQRIIDILDASNGAPTETPTPLKLFTNIISGQLNLSDMLFFCTTSLLDHLSQEKLKRLMMERSTQETVQALEALLSEAEGGSGFGALVVQLTPGEITAIGTETSTREYPRMPGMPAAPQDSMERLIAKERATNTLLTHSLWPNVGRLFKSGASRIQARVGKRSENPEEEKSGEEVQETEKLVLRPSSSNSKTQAAAAGGAALLRGIANLLGLVLRGISKLLVAILHGIQKLFSGRRLQSGARDLPRTTNRHVAQGARWFERLTPSRRRVLLLALVLILLFAQSIVSLGDRREKKKQTDLYAGYVREAKEKISAADAALLIENESGARKLLGEAQELLTKVPDEKNAPKKDVAETQKVLDEKLGAIRHEIPVNPEQVADLAGIAAGFSASLLGANDGALFTINTQTSSVYRINVDEKTTDVIVDAPSLEQTLRSFVPGGNSPLFLAADGSMQSVNIANNSLASVPLQYANTDRNVVDAALYNGRLYSLDPRNNQVFRHDASGSGFGLGNAWITEVGVDLHDARSIAVDGSVYILKGNGTIVKLSAGRTSTTSFDTVDPLLTEPTMLSTSSDETGVLVLDAKQKRIIEYTKEGVFQRQYVADAFANAADVSVDGTTVYVLAGTQVFSFPLTESGE